MLPSALESDRVRPDTDGKRLREPSRLVTGSSSTTVGQLDVVTRVYVTITRPHKGANWGGRCGLGPGVEDVEQESDEPRSGSSDPSRSHALGRGGLLDL